MKDHHSSYNEPDYIWMGNLHLQMQSGFYRLEVASVETLQLMLVVDGLDWNMCNIWIQDYWISYNEPDYIWMGNLHLQMQSGFYRLEVASVETLQLMLVVDGLDWNMCNIWIQDYWIRLIFIIGRKFRFEKGYFVGQWLQNLLWQMKG